MSIYLPDSPSLDGFRALGAGGIKSLDHWDRIRPFLAQNGGGEFITVLAEPELTNPRLLTYDWHAHAPADAVVIRGDKLDDDEFERVAMQAFKELRKLSGIAEASSIDKNALRKEIGRLSLFAVEHPLFPEDCSPTDERLRHWRSLLYSVGGKPVLVNWGVEALTPVSIPNTVTKTDVKNKPEKPPYNWARVFVCLLWFLFTSIATFIFFILMVGCGLLLKLGIGPNYCLITSYPGKVELAEEQHRAYELAKELDLIHEQMLSAPICGTDFPALLPRLGGDIDPPKDEDEKDKLVEEGDVATHMELNDLLRGAGLSSCQGIEIIAAWDKPLDIDLRAYCPLDASTEEIPDNRIIDAYEPETCGGVWEGSVFQGADSVSPLVERICLGEESEAGDYLIRVFQEESSGIIPIRLFVRQDATIAERELNTKPAEESEDYVVVQVEG